MTQNSHIRKTPSGRWLLDTRMIGWRRLRGLFIDRFESAIYSAGTPHSAACGDWVYAFSAEGHHVFVRDLGGDDFDTRHITIEAGDFLRPVRLVRGGGR